MRRPYRSTGQDVAASAGELDAGNGFAIETRLDTKSVGDQVPRYHHRVQKVPLHVDGMTEESAQVVDVTRREPGPVDMEGHQQPAVRAEGAGELAECPGSVLGVEVDDRVHRHHAGQGAVGE
jgi:hypothetical protein